MKCQLPIYRFIGSLTPFLVVQTFHGQGPQGQNKNTASEVYLNMDLLQNQHFVFNIICTIFAELCVSSHLVCHLPNEFHVSVLSVCLECTKPCIRHRQNCRMLIYVKRQQIYLTCIISLPCGSHPFLKLSRGH